VTQARLRLWDSVQNDQQMSHDDSLRIMTMTRKDKNGMKDLTTAKEDDNSSVATTTVRNAGDDVERRISLEGRRPLA
jgi:hypothetical protein